MQQASTSRASEDLLRADDRDSSERLLAGAQAATVFAIDQARRQANTFSAREELAAKFVITLVGGKWRVPILRLLQSGPIHLGELRRKLSPVSKKVLNQHLRQMTIEGLITRTDFAGKVPRVEYSLANPIGYSVLDLLKAIAEWGDRHCPQMNDDETGVASSG